MTKTRNAEGSALQKALARPVPAEIADLTAKLKTARANFDTAQAAADEFRSRPHGNVDELTGKLARVETRADVARRIDGEIPAILVKEIDDLNKQLAAAQAARDGRKERLEAFREEIDRRRELLSDVCVELSQALADWKDAALLAADNQLAEAARMIGEAYNLAEELRRETDWEYPAHLMGVASRGSHKIDGALEMPAEMRTALHEAWRANFIISRP